MNDNINLGILTGISYVTGLDYYKSINEYFMQNRKPVYELNPNPNLVFVSVDCDKYVHLLEKRNFDKVSAHLMDGITKLVNSGCNYLAIASNTGTIPTMEEDYLIGRLQLHGINTIVPEHVTDRIKIYDIIRNELSYNVFKDDSRKRIIDIIKKLTESDVVACISGCTEIELLVKQTDMPKVELFPSAQIHIKYITDLLLGRINLSEIQP